MPGPAGGAAGRRGLAVVAALAAIAVVAVVARPVEPEVPPPLHIERATPGAGGDDAREGRPGEGAEPGAEPGTEAHRADDGEGEAAGRDVPVPASGRGTLTIHPVDRDTLARRGSSVAVPVPAGFLHTEFSPDGRVLAVATARADPAPETLVRFFDTADPHAEPAEEVVGAFADRLGFLPDSSGIVWLEARQDGVQHVAGARLAGPGAGALARVPLPEGTRVQSMAALEGARVGLVLATAPAAGDPPRVELRLAVADLAAGALTAEVALPVVLQQGAAGQHRTDLVPGVAWDTERDRAYLAHPDRDAVLAVDLAAPQEPSELAAGGAGPAQAAGAEGVWRHALLSGDGAMLYVHGVRSRPAEAPATRLAAPRAGRLPLLAVDVDAGRVLDLPGPRVRVLAASPQASHVAALAGEPDPVDGLALRLLDGRTLGTRWEHPLDGPAQPWARFDATGTVLAVAGPDFARAPGPATTRVELFEPAAGELLAAASFVGIFVDLDLDAGLLLVRSLD